MVTSYRAQGSGYRVSAEGGPAFWAGPCPLNLEP